MRAKPSSPKPASAPDLARKLANLPELKHAPDIVMVAERAKRPVGEVTKTYFAAEAYFQLDRISAAVQDIAVADYFDRLALDRSLDSIGDAERRIAAAMVGNGAAGAGAVEAWVKPRQAEVERIRAAIHEIARLRSDAVEAVGRGEHAGRSGAPLARLRVKCPEIAALSATPHICRAGRVRYVVARIEGSGAIGGRQRK